MRSTGEPDIAPNHHAARGAKQRILFREDRAKGMAAMVARLRLTVLSRLAGPGGATDPTRIPDPEPEPSPVVR